MNNDIVGKIFGDMKVLSLDNTNKNYVKTYLVECIKCGNRKKIQYSRLKKLEGCYHSNIKCKKYLEEYDENIGLTVDDYTLIKLVENTKNGSKYLAKCNVCGTTFITLLHNFKRHYGTSHNACQAHIRNDNNKYLKRFKKIYSCMVYRTSNPKSTDYNRYGGRGISVMFVDFVDFYNAMFESYVEHCIKHGEGNTTLDRINVDGDYSIDNCRWATYQTQSNNRANNLYYCYENKKITLADLCRIFSKEYQTVYNRVKYLNWNINMALDLNENLITEIIN